MCPHDSGLCVSYIMAFRCTHTCTHVNRPHPNARCTRRENAKHLAAVEKVTDKLLINQEESEHVSAQLKSVATQRILREVESILNPSRSSFSDATSAVSSRRRKQSAGACSFVPHLHAMAMCGPTSCCINRHLGVCVSVCLCMCVCACVFVAVQNAPRRYPAFVMKRLNCSCNRQR